MCPPVTQVTRSGTLLLAYVSDPEHPNQWRVLVKDNRTEACLGTWRADRHEIGLRLAKLAEWDFPLDDQRDEVDA